MPAYQGLGQRPEVIAALPCDRQTFSSTEIAWLIDEPAADITEAHEGTPPSVSTARTPTVTPPPDPTALDVPPVGVSGTEALADPNIATHDEPSVT